MARLGPDVALLRRSREFRLLYAGQTFSLAGSMISYVAMPYQAYRLTHSSLVVGLLSVTAVVPLVASALLGGALADAIDRRRLILITECGLGAASAVLAVNAVAWQQLWLLFVAAAVTSFLYGLQRPSQDALVPVLVSHDDLQAAAGLVGLLGNAANLAGPLLGGGIIALGGLQAAYTVDAVTSVVALLAVALMHAVPPLAEASRPGLRSIADGIRYARSRPELLGTYLIDISAMFFGAPFALFPAIAAGLGGPAVLGLLYAAPAVGALLVSMTSGWTARVSRHGRAIVLAVIAWGTAIALLGLATSLWWAVAALAAAGAADMVSGLFRMTMWNQTVPAAYRGRLAGLEMISYTTGEPLGDLEAGLAAAVTGSVRVAVAAGGIACVLGAVAVTAFLPQLWRFDVRDHPDAATEIAGGEMPAAQAMAGPAADIPG
ncbi:MAG: MFS transporter [Actinomycetota bacterium]